MSDEELTPLSDDDLAMEAGTALPPKDVISLLDLNADLDIALDAAAPIDLAVAANANVAAPIDAAVTTPPSPSSNALRSSCRGAAPGAPARPRSRPPWRRSR